jgi:hypothetical protein
MTMWRTIIVLSIVTALSATALAQQPPAAEPKKPDEDQQQQQLRDLDQRKADEAARAEKMAADRARRMIDEQRRAVDQERRMAEQQMRAYKQALDARRAWNPAPRATRKEKVAYLGVATMEVTPELAAQLKLSPGMGLLVNAVLPDSPAERAGVKQYDVITKLDDQLLTNPEQLRVLVRMKKQSDDVKLSIIRQAAPTTASVELGQQEVDVEIGADPVGAAVGADEMPRGLVDLRAAPDGNVNFTFKPTVTDFVVNGGGGVAMTNVAGKNEMVWTDGQHTLNMEMQNGKAVQLTARLRDGRELFKGPVATDEQRAALPPDIAGKLKKAEAGGGGPLRFGGGVAMARARGGAGRQRVLTSTENDHLLVARFENGKAVHAFAFSQADGKTLFDGPVATDDQRKALPDDVAKQLDTLEKNQDAATEFGVTRQR